MQPVPTNGSYGFPAVVTARPCKGGNGEDCAATPSPPAGFYPPEHVPVTARPAVAKHHRGRHPGRPRGLHPAHEAPVWHLRPGVRGLRPGAVRGGRVRPGAVTPEEGPQRMAAIRQRIGCPVGRRRVDTTSLATATDAHHRPLSHAARLTDADASETQALPFPIGRAHPVAPGPSPPYGLPVGGPGCDRDGPASRPAARLDSGAPAPGEPAQARSIQKRRYPLAFARVGTERTRERASRAILALCPSPAQPTPPGSRPQARPAVRAPGTQSGIVIRFALDPGTRAGCAAIADGTNRSALAPATTAARPTPIAGPPASGGVHDSP